MYLIKFYGNGINNGIDPIKYTSIPTSINIDESEMSKIEKKYTINRKY